MSASAVSHAVRAAEDRVGVPLFARTTRSVALTEAGRRVVDAAMPALSEIDGVVEQIRQTRGAAGLLRLNAPGGVVERVLLPVLLETRRRHPDLAIEIYSDYALSDIVAGGFDAGIRIGGMIAQDMVTVRLTPPFRSIVVGSPDYLGRRGVPARLRDLEDHDCVTYRLMSSGALYDWELQDEGRDVKVRTAGAFIVNDPRHALALALAGAGLAYTFEPQAAEAVADGRLVEVLGAHAIEEPGLFLYFPSRAARTPKLRAFIDTAREVLKL